MKMLLAALALSTLAACGVETATTAAAVATMKKQEMDQAKKTMEQATQKIEHLNASQLKNLVKKGVLSRVYAHLLSLDNFAKLLDRKATRKAA